MMLQLRFHTLAFACLPVLACSCEQAEPETLIPPAADAEVEVGEEDGLIPGGLFGGRLPPAGEPARNTQLPADPFFREHLYPGSKDIDVKILLVHPMVFATTTDDVATVNAYYAKRFREEESSATETRGFFQRNLPNGKHYDIEVRAIGGGKVRITLGRH